MFERFTDRARRVVVLAQEEARTLGHAYIGTEHLLLGLSAEGEAVAAKALDALDISLDQIRAEVQFAIGRGSTPTEGALPYTPRAKKVLELSLREALQLGHNYIGTEHILLGLIREGEGVAAQVLVKLGADLSRVRQQVLLVLTGASRPRESIDETQVLAAARTLAEARANFVWAVERHDRLDAVADAARNEVARLLGLLSDAERAIVAAVTGA